MLVKEEIPQHLLNEATGLLNGDSEVKVAVSADLDAEGKISESWLLATDKRLLVYSANGHGLELLHNYELGRLKEIACDGQVGNGFLYANVDGRHVCLARYSEKRSRRERVSTTS